jgi:hypothetical protein
MITRKTLQELGFSHPIHSWLLGKRQFIELPFNKWYLVREGYKFVLYKRFGINNFSALVEISINETVKDLKLLLRLFNEDRIEILEINPSHYQITIKPEIKDEPKEQDKLPV